MKTKDDSAAALIVRLPNWVGDVIMALPALQALQQSGLELLLFAKPWARDLLAATDMKVTAITHSFWQNSQKMAELSHCNKALLLTNSFSSALMARVAGKATIGYHTNVRYPLLKRSLTKEAHRHEVEYFWNIARLACQYWYPELNIPTIIPQKITLPCSLSAMATAEEALNRAKISQPYWVLCPFAHGTGKAGQSKIWPHWRELSAQLTQHQLIVCPGKNEEALCAELVPEALILSGLNLGEYAAILAKAAYVIANDSGPMHIASAVGATTLGIFGVSDPKRTSPWGGAFIGARDCWPSLSEVLAEVRAFKN